MDGYFCIGLTYVTKALTSISVCLGIVHFITRLVHGANFGHDSVNVCCELEAGLIRYAEISSNVCEADFSFIKIVRVSCDTSIAPTSKNHCHAFLMTLFTATGLTIDKWYEGITAWRQLRRWQFRPQRTISNREHTVSKHKVWTAHGRHH